MQKREENCERIFTYSLAGGEVLQPNGRIL